MESSIQATTDRLDKIADQFSRGMISREEFESQRLVILLDFKISVLEKV